MLRSRKNSEFEPTAVGSGRILLNEFKNEIYITSDGKIKVCVTNCDISLCGQRLGVMVRVFCVVQSDFSTIRACNADIF